jgi:hippurate hydrolase
MGGEDFARYGRQEPPIPSALLWLGAVDPAAVEAAAAAGTSLPSLHSSRFAPLPGPTITAGVTVLTQAALEVLGTPES